MRLVVLVLVLSACGPAIAPEESDRNERAVHFVVSESEDPLPGELHCWVYREYASGSSGLGAGMWCERVTG